MAWSVSITVTDLPGRLATVEATRTVGEDVRTYHLSSVWIDMGNLPQTRQQIVDAIWAQHEAALTRDTAVEEMVGGWETALAGDLDILEVG